MTTHRRTVLLRVGVALAAAAGSLIVAAPAYAADVNVELSESSFELAPGGSRPLVVRLQNTTNQSKQARVTVTPPSGLDDVEVRGADGGCNGSGRGVSCNTTLAANDTKDLNLTVSAKSPGALKAGETKQGRGSVSVAFGDRKDFNVTLRGPNQAPNVTQITGKVVDSKTGSPLGGATVVLQDAGACAPGSGRQTCTTGTNDQGNFRFSSQDKQITPGTIQIGATRDGYDQKVTSITASAGQSPSVTLKLTPKAANSASATPPAEEAPPNAEAPDGNAAVPKATTKKASEGTSTFSWIIIILAGLLVLLGLGVLVMMLINRKKGDDEAADDANQPPGRGPVPGGAYAGGAPGQADATMVSNHAMAGAPGAGDATAILRPSVDEYPDPYASPLPPYPNSAAGYPPAGANGHGGGAGYGATQMHPAAQPGYGQGPTAYGTAAPRGPEQGGGYGGAGAPGHAHRPSHGQDAGYGPDRGYGHEPAGYGGGDPGYGGGDPAYGGGDPAYGGGDPRYGGGDPAYGGGDPAYGGGDPRYGGGAQAGGAHAGGAHGYEPTRQHDAGAGYPPPQGAQQPGAPQQGGYSGGYDPAGGYGGYDQPDGGYGRAGGYDSGSPRSGADPRDGYGPGYNGAGHHAEPTEAVRRPGPARGRGRPVEWLDD